MSKLKTHKCLTFKEARRLRKQHRDAPPGTFLCGRKIKLRRKKRRGAKR